MAGLVRVPETQEIDRRAAFIDHFHVVIAFRGHRYIYIRRRTNLGGSNIGPSAVVRRDIDLYVRRRRAFGVYQLQTRQIRYSRRSLHDAVDRQRDAVRRAVKSECASGRAGISD